MKLRFDLKDKVVFITGASSGIGKYSAFAFAEAGAKVILGSPEDAKLTEIAKEIRMLGGKVLTLSLDVRSLESIKAAVKTATEFFGHIDVLINNAGILVRQDLFDYTEEAWDDTCNTNLKGVFFLSREVAREMIKKNISGSIVNIASSAGFRPRKNSLAYAVSKAGLEHLTRVLAVEFAEYKIRVNAVSPGVFVTDITRDFLLTEGGKALIENILIKRPGELAELIPSILLFASDFSSYMTGSILRIDGGLACNALS